MRAVLIGVLTVLSSCSPVAAATFGTVVTIGGHASDLALDEQRGRLYIANFAGRRIDVMSTSDNTLQNSIPMTTQGESGSLALSPDDRYLVVTNYDNCVQCDFLQGSAIPTVTVIDLTNNNSSQTCMVPPQPLPPGTLLPTIPCPPLSPPPPTVATPNIPYTVAFGKGSKALIVTTNMAFLFDPATLTFTPVPPTPTSCEFSLSSLPLPVPFATFPPQIIQASDGVSGDGETIVVVAQGTQPQAATATTPAVPGSELILLYKVGTNNILMDSFESTPSIGPRLVTVNNDGSSFLAGWALLQPTFGPNDCLNDILLAEFPYPTGALNLGSAAFDFSRNFIYAQIPSGGPSDPPVLHVVDSDNLTVRERIQLPQNLAGRSVFSSDMNTLYAISDDGVTVLPVGSLSSAHRVSTQEEQLLFLSGGCTSGPIQQTLHVIDLGGGTVDFTLSLPAGTQGITFSQTSGTTPASVTIQIDPNAFMAQTGTTVVPLTIRSAGSIGIPSQVRLLINTKDPDQRGIIHSLPGTIVDIAADPQRPVVYALRQDRNQVIVIDGSTFNTLAILRTGNTPTKMAFTRDGKYMMVGNDHSQIANVFDLDALQSTPSIVFPRGHYPRSIAAANSTILAISRNSPSPQFGAPVQVSGPGGPCAGPAGPAEIDQVDFGNRNATVACSLGIYINGLPVDAVMAASPSGASIFTAMADGTVLLYNDTYQAFQASRKDLTALGGSFAAVSDNIFLAGGILFDNSMVQIGPINTATPTSSILITGNTALTITANAPSAPGLIDIVPLSGTTVQPARSIEAPVTQAILTTTPVGQIGQTVSAFLNTIAIASNGSTLYLSISGFTELPANFNQPAAIPAVTSVVNSADGGPVSSGSLITIWGSGLSTASATAASLPLSNSLAEVCVTANSSAIPLIHVSSNRIDAQLPYEISGAANLAVTGPGGASTPFRFNAEPTALAIFQNGSVGDASQPLIYRASNNALVTFANPIKPGDTLVILATGLGQTSPPAVSGAAATADPLETTVSIPSISLGGAPLTVNFAGLTPGMVGLYQINAVVPGNVPTGAQVPLVVQQANSSSSFMLSVANQ